MNPDDTRRHLTEIPDLYALLPLFIEPGVGISSDEVRSGHPGSKPPIDLANLDLLDLRPKDLDPRRADADLDRRAGDRRAGVLPVLGSWVRLVDEELTADEADGSWTGGPHDWPGRAPCSGFVIVGGPLDGATSCTGQRADHTAPATVASEAAFLLLYLDYVADQQWFRELAGDVYGIWRDLRAAIREPDDPELVCLKDGCDWPVEQMDQGSWFRCTGCGHIVTRVEVHRLYERQKPMPLSECAALLDRPVKTLHRWRSDGLFRHVGRDERGALFRYADVLAAAAAVATR